jgi:ferredoxin
MSTAHTGQVRYEIDKEACAGHGRCYMLAPESFTADDVGYGEVVDKAEPAGREEEMKSMTLACPEGAITVESA